MVKNKNSHLIFYLCKKSNNIKEQFLQKMLKLEIYIIALRLCEIQLSCCNQFGKHIIEHEGTVLKKAFI
mgnify:CR=1 FL=1